LHHIIFYYFVMNNIFSRAAAIFGWLVKQKDPRALGNGTIFDTYYYMGFEAMKKMYGERFKLPEHLKKYEFISNGKVD
jgi:hypothetical protein